MNTELKNQLIEMIKEYKDLRDKKLLLNKKAMEGRINFDKSFKALEAKIDQRKKAYDIVSFLLENESSI